MIFHASVQGRHFHALCPGDYVDEPAEVQHRLKLALFGLVRLHVEDEGESALVALGDLLQSLLFTRLHLKEHSVAVLAALEEAVGTGEVQDDWNSSEIPFHKI